MENVDKLIKPYIRTLDEQSALYEYYARQHGLQSKGMQILLWVSNYPQSTGRYMTQKLLVEKTYSTKQVINATIKNWQRKGYIELLENPSDKRHKLIKLTDLGEQYSSSIIQPLNRIEKAVINYLSEDEQEILLKLTEKYNIALKAEMGKLYDKL